jgi:prepilin-type processing-associated H-X9-DG protein/prepilin-type N-terminal cleavage/methylation domain-containing protein
MSCTLHRGRRWGFTLVELLVVLAVLALMAAILLPSLSVARARARETDCRSRLHQIGLALRMYSDDNNGGFPSSLGTLYSGWSFELIRYLHKTPPYGCPDVKNWVFNPHIRPTVDEILAGYSYNSLLGAPSRLNGYSPWMTMAQVRAPAVTVSFCEAHMGVITLPQPDRSEGWEGGPHEAGALRHRGGANYAFLDGHVKWYRPEVIDPPGRHRVDGVPTFLPN